MATEDDWIEEAVKIQMGLPFICPWCEKRHRNPKTGVALHHIWRQKEKVSGLIESSVSHCFNDLRNSWKYNHEKIDYFLGPVVAAFNGERLGDIEGDQRQLEFKIRDEVITSKIPEYWLYLYDRIGAEIDALAKKKYLAEYLAIINRKNKWADWCGWIRRDFLSGNTTWTNPTFQPGDRGRGSRIKGVSLNWHAAMTVIEVNVNHKILCDWYFKLGKAGLQKASKRMSESGYGAMTLRERDIDIIAWSDDLNTAILCERSWEKTWAGEKNDQWYYYVVQRRGGEFLKKCLYHAGADLDFDINDKGQVEDLLYNRWSQKPSVYAADEDEYEGIFY